MTDMDTYAGRRQELYQLLGELPDRNRPIAVVSRARRAHPRYVLEEIVLDLNGVEHVPSYFVHPKEGSGPWPAVLYNHAHGGVDAECIGALGLSMGSTMAWWLAALDT